MKRTGLMNEVQIDKLDVEDKQQSESEAEAPTEASSDSDHSSEAEAPTEASNSEDDSKSGTRTTPSKHSTLTVPLSIVSGDVKQRIQESIVDSDEDVDDAKLLFIFAVKAIVVIVNGNKPNVIFGKGQLDIPPGLDIISAETG